MVKEADMEVTMIFQFLFWLLLGLWFWGVRFPFMEQIIGGIAFVNALLMVL
jgi:hypothetical protein